MPEKYAKLVVFDREHPVESLVSLLGPLGFGLGLARAVLLVVDLIFVTLLSNSKSQRVG